MTQWRGPVRPYCADWCSALFSSAVWMLSKYPDLPVIVCFLNWESQFAYLSARIISLSIPLALQIVGSQVKPQLTLLSQAVDRSQLRSAAARVNLAYLMICGAIALLVLVVTRLLVETSFLERFQFQATLIWLILGQCTPALFGATALMMQVAGRDALNQLLLALSGALFVISILLLNADSTIVVAQTFAVAQLTHAAICAIVLTRWGVWPGLTALFHKKIRLF